MIDMRIRGEGRRMFKFLKERFSSLKNKADDLDEEIFVEEKGKKIKEKKIDEFLWELECSLLQADVALAVVEEIKGNVREELLTKRIKKGVGVNETIENALKRAVANVLSVNPIKFDDFIEEQEKPIILMFVGVNGTGKTTVIAKFAHHLQKQHKSCVLAASDTFRAGAIEQLNVHADKLGVKLIKHRSGSDPAAVAYDAVEHARARRKDVVLIDTAGRMQTNINLMDEMKKIKRVAKPSMIIFVGDALAGNDAVEQAKKFDEAVGIDATVLTKIDADAKGGAALSIAYAVNKPIIFLGTGQNYDDLVPFNTDWMVQRLFG